MIVTGDPCPACGKSPWSPSHVNEEHDADVESLGELIEWAYERV